MKALKLLKFFSRSSGRSLIKNRRVFLKWFVLGSKYIRQVTFVCYYNEVHTVYLYNRTKYIPSRIWPQNLLNRFELNIVLGYFEYFMVYLILICFCFIKQGLLQNKLSVFCTTKLCDTNCKLVIIYSYLFHILGYMCIERSKSKIVCVSLIQKSNLG